MPVADGDDAVPVAGLASSIDGPGGTETPILADLDSIDGPAIDRIGLSSINARPGLP
jgi:hypothetical protein